MRTLEIHQFLTWAFTQELWKVGAGAAPGSSSSFSMISNFGTYGSHIDRTPNEFGLVPFSEAGEPHPDALLAGRMIKALPALDVPDELELFGDWPDPNGNVGRQVRDELAAFRRRGDQVNREHVIALVISCSILGRAPAWQSDYPGETMVMRFGKPAWFVARKRTDPRGGTYQIEADGYDKKSGRPVKGAYRKWALREPIRLCIHARMDWVLWQQALALLADGLSGRLIDHKLHAFHPNPAIWMTTTGSGRVLQGIGKASQSG